MRKLAVLSAIILLGMTSTTQASVTSNRQVIRNVFGYSPTAQCTAQRESQFNEKAINYNNGATFLGTDRKHHAAIDRGLFQIDSIHIGTRVHYWSPSQRRAVDITIGYARRGRKWVGAKVLFRPTYNARVAWAMSKGGTDWGPWNGGTSSCGLS